MSLSQSLKDMAKRIFRLESQIKNLRVGGRNLILNSKQELRVSADSTKADNYLQLEVVQDVDLSEVRQLVISSYIKFNDLRRNGSKFWRIGVEARVVYTDNSVAWSSAWLVAPVSGSLNAYSRRHSVVFNVASGKKIKQIDYAAIAIQNVNSSGEMIVANPQIEIGNVPSDWRPAHEDYDAELAAIKQRLSRLSY